MQVDEQNRLKTKYEHLIGTWAEFRLEDVEQSVASRFEQQVARYGNRVAVKRDALTLTYRQLNAQANQIGRIITTIPNAQAVSLLLDNDEQMIASILGALKTGRPYVPLDPAFPQDRLTYYLSDSFANIIVTNNAHATLAAQLATSEQHILNIDHLDDRVSADNLTSLVTSDAIAYIYYTSGSTGQSKSVYNSHRNLLHHIRRNSNSFRICPDDRLICLKSFSFNGALKDLFGALLNGASLHLYPLKQRGTVGLGQWLIDNKITIYNSVATVFRQLVSSLKPEMRFPDLRIVFTGGERIKPSDVVAYRQYFAEHSLFSLGLGATEAGAITRIHLDTDSPMIDTIASGNTVPVGYLLDEMEAMILDETDQPLGVCEEGQIAIRSRYLASGYWNKPDLTAEKFSDDIDGTRIYQTGDIGYLDEAGCLWVIGRKDNQVKIRGFRVGLGEVEHALMQQPAIKQAVVVAKNTLSERGDYHLVAYYVLNEPTTVTTLRRALADKLPDYMIPSAFVPLEAFPTTPFGKLDLKALKDPTLTRPALEVGYVSAETPTQHELVTIWASILGFDQVGIHDDFFELGGESIRLMELFAKVEDELGIDLPIDEFMEEATIAKMAQLLKESA